jgi:nucleoside-diphosphate-sugar epimerase
MNVIIAGGAGFVGRNLVRIMLKEEFKPENITVIDIDQENLKFFDRYKIKTIKADLSEDGQWRSGFKNADYVINLAAQISSPDSDPFYRNNIVATQEVVDAARDDGVKGIIHFSSAAVLSVRKDDYSNTKIEGEEIVKNSGLNYCIIRPSLLYGPTDDKNIGYLLNFSRKFPFFPIPGNGKWPRQPIYIDDMCYLVISFLKDFPKNQIYDINGKEIIYFKDMIKTVLDESDGFRFRIFLPVSLFKFAMMFYQRLIGNVEFTPEQVDSLTAEETFPVHPWWEEHNIKITSFQQGVRKMIEEDKLLISTGEQ